MKKSLMCETHKTKACERVGVEAYPGGDFEAKWPIVFVAKFHRWSLSSLVIHLRMDTTKQTGTVQKILPQ